jgi:hypothetical protein
MTYLRQFRNLLLDEEACFDIHEIELRRIERIARRNLLKSKSKAVFPNISAYLNDNSLARRLLLHDELPAGCIGRYEIDEKCAYIMVMDNNKRRWEKVETTEVIVPTYQVSRTNITNESKARAWFLKKENDAFFEMLEKTEQFVYGTELNGAIFNQAFRQIEEHGDTVHSIIIGKKTLDFINQNFGTDLFDRINDRYNQNLVGNLFTADVYCSNHPILDTKSFVLSTPETVGTFTERGYVAGFGWHAEEYGMMLAHPQLVSCIECV